MAVYLGKLASRLFKPVKSIIPVFNQLPDEFIVQIFSFLKDPKDMAHFEMTCKRIFAISRKNKLSVHWIPFPQHFCHANLPVPDKTIELMKQEAPFTKKELCIDEFAKLVDQCPISIDGINYTAVGKVEFDKCKTNFLKLFNRKIMCLFKTHCSENGKVLIRPLAGSNVLLTLTKDVICTFIKANAANSLVKAKWEHLYSKLGEEIFNNSVSCFAERPLNLITLKEFKKFIRELHSCYPQNNSDSFAYEIIRKINRYHSQQDLQAAENEHIASGNQDDADFISALQRIRTVHDVNRFGGRLLNN